MATTQFSIPFVLDIDDTSDDNAGPLSCIKLVRLVPGKRLVCAGAWRGEDVFVKIFLPMQGARRRWQREERAIQTLLSKDVLTPPLLYSGYLQGPGVYVLVSRTIAGARDALQAWHDADDDAKRLALLRQLVHAVAQHHRAGLVQRDLHLRNFLVQDGRIYTIDASRIRVSGSPVARHGSIENLGLLLAQLYPEFDRFVTDVYPDYVQARGWDVKDTELATLKLAIERSRIIRTRRYLQRIRKERVFPSYRNNKQFVRYDKSYDSKELKAILKDPDAALESAVYLKQGNTSTVGITTIGSQRLVIKRYNIKSLRHGLSRALRRTRASLSWRNALILRFHGIDTAPPVAVIEQRAGLVRQKSYFVSEYIDGSNATDFFLSQAVSAEKKSIIARKISTLLDILASLRIRHGDLKATNFIICDDRPFLMDLDAMRQYKLGSRFKPLRQRDRIRFMRNWDNHPSLRTLFEEAEQGAG
jgi:tRNA A-37 threonylcarbamoyl transferase component Bud32